MKPLVDDGHMLVAQKPFRLGRRVYAPDRLPCPVQHAGCLILVNDRHDAGRMRVAFSDGSSWAFLVRAGEAEQTSEAVAVRPAEVDLTPIVRAAVNEALPAMLPAPVRIVEHAPQAAMADMTQVDELREHVRVLAAANLELAEQYARLLERLEFVERHALARAELEVR